MKFRMHASNENRRHLWISITSPGSRNMSLPLSSRIALNRCTFLPRVTVTLSLHQTGFLAPIVGLLSARLTRRYIDMEANGLKADRFYLLPNALESNQRESCTPPCEVPDPQETRMLSVCRLEGSERHSLGVAKHGLDGLEDVLDPQPPFSRWHEFPPRRSDHGAAA